MSTTASPIRSAAPGGSLADRVGRRGLATDLALIAAGIALVAGLAQVEVPMWPVPVTGQTLGVVLVGAALGARRATAALTGYLLLGLAGLPIFAGFGGGLLYVTKPSFGFIIGFIGAAALIGALADRRWDRKPARALLAVLLASVVPFLVGVPYMAIVLGAMGLPHDPATVLSLGVTPFLLGGVVKWLIAAAVLPAVWRLVGMADVRRHRPDRP